jgi:3-hydroxyacyl-CoA dehydrogenase
MIGVVGGGTMGAGIAAACLLRGLDVTLLERDQASADAAQTRVSDILNGSAKRGLIPDVACVIARFRTAVQYSALSDRDLVIEAVFEDIAVKKDVFRQLEAHLRADAILATNTSYLDVNDIAACLANPSRAIGLHFFSPAHVMKLLEIVVPDAARDEVIATAAALAKRLGKIGVLAGVCDGFIGNRIMSAYRREADILLIEGASPSQIDAAMRDYGMAMGIYQMQDLAGLDIAWAMRKRRALSHPATAGQAGIADTLCELGRFGQKTGAGWYDYHTGQAAPSQTVAQIIAANQAAAGVTPCSFTAAQIMQRILTAFRAEAAAVLNANIAKSRDDITVVMVNGYGFPRWLQW